VVSKELRAAEGRLCAHSDKNAAERVAEAVLFLREKFPSQNWTRKEIAEWAGTTPETVMRSLADFETRGLIEQVGRKINILDRSALVKEANLIF
jgi:CRP-like cAMP-binding protein